MKILNAAEAALQAAAPGAKGVIQNMLEQLTGELESLEDISSILSKAVKFKRVEGGWKKSVVTALQEKAGDQIQRANAISKAVRAQLA